MPPLMGVPRTLMDWVLLAPFVKDFLEDRRDIRLRLAMVEVPSVGGWFSPWRGMECPRWCHSAQLHQVKLCDGP